MKTALSIAGSDSCCGAGIQADLKTFSANGVYGLNVITAVTAQNTQGVTYVKDLDPITIENQLDALFNDISINSIKIGMLSNAKTINTIVNTLKKYKIPPIVLDPVMISTSGYTLLSEDAIKTLVQDLFPLTEIITPNVPEAEYLINNKISTINDMKLACKKLISLGSKNILLKGGHLHSDKCTDILYDGNTFHIYEEEKIQTNNTHGTGCTLSSAIAANISLGNDIKTSVQNAKIYTTNAIKYSFPIGKGKGPTNHFYNFNRNSNIKS